MKIFIFVLTVLFTLTVTLQESLAQAAAKVTEAKNIVTDFADKPEGDFLEQAKKEGISDTEGDFQANAFASPNEQLRVKLMGSSSLDRHTDTSKVQLLKKQEAVKDAIGGGKSSK